MSSGTGPSLAGQSAQEHGRQVLEETGRESQHLKEVLARSRRVRSQAIPVLKKAGYLR